jgi:orotate phosphoribosyltransferase-like protein
MNDELKEKMNTLMYFLTKEAARSSFVEFIEDIGISDEDYKDIKAEWKKIGITKTYV